MRSAVACRYVFRGEDAAAASPDGRSDTYIVARSEAEAMEQALNRLVTRV